MCFFYNTGCPFLGTFLVVVFSNFFAIVTFIENDNIKYDMLR